MNKKVKVFLKVIYYIFTFGLGLLLAVALPGILFYEDLALEMENSLQEGRYSSAMNLIGGFFDEEYVYEEKFEDGGGIVGFRAATLFENKEETATQMYSIHRTYSFFLYNVKDKYKVEKSSDNFASVKVTDSSDRTYTIDVLNYDSDGDLVFDTVSTMIDFTYVYFEIPESKLESIKNLKIIDADGKTYKEISVNLDFTNLFFTSLDSFIAEYNRNSGSSSLQELSEQFLKVDESFKMGDHGDIQTESTTRATWIVFGYFVWIYILGDLLVGKKYILKFFKWLVAKIKGQKPEETPKENYYGTDYYSKLTYKLEVPEDCDINISINYHNENYQIEMLFTKDNNYQVVQRVHAGTYVNAWLECPGYEALNLPKELVVRGYMVNVNVTINKIKEEINSTGNEEDKNEN